MATAVAESSSGRRSPRSPLRHSSDEAKLPRLQDQDDTPQAGPSNLHRRNGAASTNQSEVGSNGTSRKAKKKNKSRNASPQRESKSKPAHSELEARTSSFGEDFIALGASDDEEFAEEKRPVREWDKGKSRAQAQAHARSERKRQQDEADFVDDYANKKQRMDAASRRAPWVSNVDWDSCNNVAEMLHKEVVAFIDYISPTPVEDEVRSLVVALISNAVQRAFPDAEVIPFGSYETKLYLPLGDIDLVVHSPSMAYSKQTNVLHALANTVKRAGITDRVTIVAKAKVPIIKFVTTHGHFAVDISINRGNGVAAGKMIKYFLRELPALRSLVLITKSFLSQRSMNEVFTGGLGSYSIVCMAISFLQMHPKIRRGEIDPSQNLGVLVMEFFELYGCYFNYQEVGISVRDGGTYYNKAERGWLNYNSPGLLSIEDPGDSSNDISRGTYGIAKVRATLAGAHGIMTAAAFLKAGYISARRYHRTVHLRDTGNPEDMSILASVMGVTQETINHRRVVQEVYDNQVLHRMLGMDPRPTVTIHVPSSTENGRKRKRAAEASVEAAWGEADMDLESVGRPEDDNEAEENDEESRYYGIDARPHPKKRRKKKSKRKETHVDTVRTEEAMFTEDEDEGSEYAANSEAEDDEYDIDGGDDKVPLGSKRARTRSYWLSKGISI